MAWGAKDDRRDRIAMRRRRSETQKQRHRGGRVHAVGEGKKQRRSRHPSDARKNAQGEPAQNAAPKKQQSMRLGNDVQALPKGVKPIQHLGTFRVVDPPARIPGPCVTRRAPPARLLFRPRTHCPPTGGSGGLSTSRPNGAFVAVPRSNRRKAGRRSSAPRGERSARNQTGGPLASRTRTGLHLPNVSCLAARKSSNREQ